MFSKRSISDYVFWNFSSLSLSLSLSLSPFFSKETGKIDFRTSEAWREKKEKKKKEKKSRGIKIPTSAKNLGQRFRNNGPRKSIAFKLKMTIIRETSG